MITAQYTPIANIEAERAVIGSLIIDNSVFYEVAPVIAPDDFYREPHKHIYAAMCDMWRAGVAVDFVTLTERLSGQLQEVGGASYIASLINDTPSAAHAGHYARLVKQAALRRRLLDTAIELTKAAYSDADPENVAARTVMRLSDVARAGASDDGFLAWERSFAVWAEGQLDRQIELSRNLPKTGMPWPCLSFVRPLRAGTLAVITAGSGVGKTAFAENLAETWAGRGLQVVYMHLELSHQVMLDRRMARWSGEPMVVIERGELTEAMQRADDAMRSWPGAVHYVECSGWSVSRIISEVRARRAAQQCDVVVVDYFNKIALEVPHGSNITTARGLIVEQLKTMAEREKIPVVLLAQLSKDGKQQERKTGVGIRDTGELEDKCNLLITLDRPILNEPLIVNGRVVAQAGTRSPHTTVRVDKQTLGETGETTLYFLGHRFMFVQMEKDK